MVFVSIVFRLLVAALAGIKCSTVLFTVMTVSTFSTMENISRSVVNKSITMYRVKKT